MTSIENLEPRLLLTQVPWRYPFANQSHAAIAAALYHPARHGTPKAKVAAAVKPAPPVHVDPFYASEIRGGEEEEGEPLPYAGTTGPAAPVLIGSATETVGFDTQASTTGYYEIPPDSNVAAGPNHVIDVVNSVIEWRTKSGTLQNLQRLGKNGSTATGSFFASLNPINTLFDPKITYDQYAGRFVVVALEEDNSAQSSRILVAISNTSDPNQGWNFGAINSKVAVGNPKHATQTWTDYPGLAVDGQAIYVTGNLFGFGGRGSFQGTRLWILPKSTFYAGGAMTSAIYDPATASGLGATAGFTLQPAAMFGTAPAGVGTFLVSSGYVSGATDQLSVIRVNNPLSSPTFTNQQVNVGDIHNNAVAFPGDAPQLGTTQTVDGGDQRVMNAVWRNGFLYACNSVNPTSGPDAGQLTAHWYKISTANLGALTIADQGNVGGEDIAAGTRTFYPWLSVDNDGDMAIGFAASGPNIHPGAYYTGRLVGDAAGTVQSTQTLAAGVDTYFRAFGATNRWGDYSGMALDPDGSTFWVFGEYAQARGSVLSQYPTEDGRWGTRSGSFTFATPVSVSGTVFADNNFSATQEGSEHGIASVTVFVDANGNTTLDASEPSAVTDANGNYVLPGLVAGTYTVRAIPPANSLATTPASLSVNATAGSATGVNFGYFPTLFAGSGGGNNFYLRLDPTGTNLEISQSSAPLSPPTYTAPRAALPALTFTTTGASDALRIDLTNGSPLPAAGISYNGSSIAVIGSAGSDTLSLSSSSIAVNSLPVSYSGVSSISLSTAGGDDAVTLNGSIPATLALSLGTGNDSLTLDSSPLTLASDAAAIISPNLTINANGASALLFTATQHLARLNLFGSSHATLSAGATKLLVLGGLSISPSATLDLTDNAMILDPATPGDVASLVASLSSAYAGGAWTGPGLTSDAARTNPAHDTALGYATAAQLGLSAFSSEPVSPDALIVKYTYQGDVNIDGRITSDDLALADRALAMQPPPSWLAADFNYDSLIAPADLALLEQAYASQGAPL